MNLRKRRRRRLMVAVLLVLAVLFFLLLRLRFAPMVEALSMTTVNNETATLINNAIDAYIEAGYIHYDRIIRLEKNAEGRVTAMQTDMTEVNRLKTEILDEINKEIVELSVEDLSVPLGSIIMPELFSGRGPGIPVKLMTIKSSGAEFHNSFSEAGINQTLHQIILDVGVTVTILTPNGTEDVNIQSEAVVAQTVIVGEVPQTMISLTEETGG